MLTYRCTDTLEVVGFSNYDFTSCVDDKKSTSCYIFMMAEGVVLLKSVKRTHNDFFYYGGRLCGML